MTPDAAPAAPILLTLTAAARRAGLAPATLRAAVRDGRLRTVRPVRRRYVPLAALEDWLRRGDPLPRPAAPPVRRAVRQQAPAEPPDEVTAWINRRLGITG